MSELSLSGDMDDGDERYGGLDAPRWNGLRGKHMTAAQLEEILKRVDVAAREYRKRMDEWQ